MHVVATALAVFALATPAAATSPIPIPVSEPGTLSILAAGIAVAAVILRLRNRK